MEKLLESQWDENELKMNLSGKVRRKKFKMLVYISVVFKLYSYIKKQLF